MEVGAGPGHKTELLGVIPGDMATGLNDLVQAASILGSFQGSKRSRFEGSCRRCSKMQSQRDLIKREMWGSVLGRSTGLKPKTTARSWCIQGSATCRVLLGHLQRDGIPQLERWGDDSVWKVFAEQA